jgi:hypothetical protein
MGRKPVEEGWIALFNFVEHMLPDLTINGWVIRESHFP